MNKKNLILTVILMLSSTVFILPMKPLTQKEEQERRDHICALREK